MSIEIGVKDGNIYCLRASFRYEAYIPANVLTGGADKKIRIKMVDAYRPCFISLKEE